MSFSSSLRVLTASSIVLYSFLLSACDDGNGSGGSGAVIQAGAAVLVSASVDPAGANCADGGVKVTSGRDTNGNGILETSEVTNVQYACNGTPGLRSIVRTVTLAAGNSQCPAGGDAVEAGVDTSGNGVLDASEITSTEYVCNGATGSPGIAGKNSDINIVALAAGAICEYGGYTITAGPDNGSGQIATVTSVAHLCDGAPGADVTWVDVTGLSQQAQSNIGYLADNAARVTITLPDAPAVGDLIRVSGAGVGGWTIAQNAGQTIRTLGLPMESTTWLPRTGGGQRDWVSIASSSDGSHLAAADANPGFIYTSVDGGATWTEQTASGQRFWDSIASSSDGSHLAAADANPGFIYTSVDGGLTWTQQTGSGQRTWRGIASSSNGSHLAVGDGNNGYIYTSTDGGATWTTQAASGLHFWISIASSSDGAHLAAADGNNGYVYTSVDGGATWTQRTGSGPHYWASIASSSDGSHLAAVGLNNMVTSADFGVTWTVVPPLAGDQWHSIASSADGSQLAAIQYNGSIYTSVNFGASWAQSNSGIRTWYVIASSSDGSRLAACDSGGYIYTEFLQTRTTVGTAGSLTGYQYDTIELQYLGGEVFGVLSFSSYSGAFTVQ